MSGGFGSYSEGNYCGLFGGIHLKGYSLPKICTMYIQHTNQK